MTLYSIFVTYVSGALFRCFQRECILSPVFRLGQSSTKRKESVRDSFPNSSQVWTRLSKQLPNTPRTRVGIRLYDKTLESTCPDPAQNILRISRSKNIVSFIIFIYRSLAMIILPKLDLLWTFNIYNIIIVVTIIVIAYVFHVWSVVIKGASKPTEVQWFWPGPIPK